MIEKEVLTKRFESEWQAYCREMGDAKDWPETKALMEGLWARMAEVALKEMKNETDL